MKSTTKLLLAGCILFFVFVVPEKALAACGEDPQIGCMYYYGNEDCSEIWGGRHTCYPVAKWHMCSCEDCQGPNGDRCSGGGSGPSATPVVSQPTPTVYQIQFLGIKLGPIRPLQPMEIVKAVLSVFGINL